MEIQRQYGVFSLDAPSTGAGTKKGKGDSNDITLQIKLGVGFGNCQILILGGVLDRCEYLVSGDAFTQAFECENDCVPGKVILSKKVM